jgi:hypothetical protein
MTRKRPEPSLIPPMNPTIEPATPTGIAAIAAALTAPQSPPEFVGTVIAKLPADEATGNPRVVIDMTAAQPPDSLLRDRVRELEAWQAGVRASRNEVATAALEWEERKAAASAAKSAYDQAVEREQQAIDAQPVVLPLIDKPWEKEGATAIDGEAWRFVPLTELVQHGASAKSIELLSSFLTDHLYSATLGSMTDYQNKPFQRLTDVPGIGQAKADRIADAATAWFAAHPDQRPAVKEPAAVSANPGPAPQPEPDPDFEANDIPGPLAAELRMGQIEDMNELAKSVDLGWNPAAAIQDDDDVDVVRAAVTRWNGRKLPGGGVVGADIVGAN